MQAGMLDVKVYLNYYESHMFLKNLIILHLISVLFVRLNASIIFAPF